MMIGVDVASLGPEKNFESNERRTVAEMLCYSWPELFLLDNST